MMLILMQTPSVNASFLDPGLESRPSRSSGEEGLPRMDAVPATLFASEPMILYLCQPLKTRPFESLSFMVLDGSLAPFKCQ